jgi:hypothetical protein
VHPHPRNGKVDFYQKGTVLQALERIFSDQRIIIDLI